MKKIILDENEIPKNWYNIQADMKDPLDPPLNPKTKKPIGPDDLKAIFPMELIKQEVSQDRYIKIPEEVREIYRVLAAWEQDYQVTALHHLHVP